MNGQVSLNIFEYFYYINWIFNGVYHFDGVFEGSARYRATFREDWWILKKDGEWTGEFE